jgi:Zn-dependent protease with chaperone function
MAIIAHELAHYRLKHYENAIMDSLLKEDEADQLAKE